VAFDDGGRISWCLMESAMDYDKAMATQRMAGTTRGREGVQGEATKQQAGRMRGQESGTTRGQ
jgi:hypothetical protein